jgi:phosphomannomutase/phosphoglucomutase
MKPEIFREYDIRGIVGRDLDEGVVEKIGIGFGTYMDRMGAKSVCIGRDSRLSSPALKDAMVMGLLSTGRDVVDVGEIPTPGLYFATQHLRVDAGVMITASHNPKDFNGIKLRIKENPIYGEEIQRLREMIEKGERIMGKGEYRKEDLLSSYLDRLGDGIQIEKGLRVVVDAGNGTTGLFAPPILERLGCDVIPLYCEPDGEFPHHLPDPTIQEYMEDLSSKVKEVGADIGIAYDGDGDRVGVVDEEGRGIFADHLLILFSREILKKGHAHIIFDVKCSQALIEEIERYGGTPVMWKTGYPLIQQKMKELDSPLAGEMSGHIYFRDRYLGFDDGIYASLRLLEILSTQREPISHLLKDLPRYYSTPEIRVPFRDDLKFDVVKRISSFFRENHQVIDVDGVRVVFEDGWALVRASNTQPALVLRFEAKTEARLYELMELIRSKLKEHSSIPIEF